MPDFLPHLPEDFEDTRATLHAYSNAVGVVPRAHGIAHPKWWHISLKVRPVGLATDNMPLPGGGVLDLTMNLARHVVEIEGTGGTTDEIPLDGGLTATEMGDGIIAAVAAHGLGGDFDRARFESGDPRPYDPDTAQAYLGVLGNVSTVLERHRASLDGSLGPVQVWPHGFDLAFEWFGTRVETHEEGGVPTAHPSQINFGFYPGDEPYFFSNPWPFDEGLLGKGLPHGAEWHTAGWQGTILRYDRIAGDPDAAAKLAEYFARVFELASPGLLV